MFNLKDDYSTTIREIIETFLTLGIELHLIGHVISESSDIEDDYKANLKNKRGILLSYSSPKVFFTN